MGRLNLLFLKEENGSLEGTKRKGEQDGFFQSVPGSLCFGEKSNFSFIHFTLHRDGDSLFFQKGETQEEESAKIGKGSREGGIKSPSQALENLLILNTAMDRFDSC